MSDLILRRSRPLPNFSTIAKGGGEPVGLAVGALLILGNWRIAAALLAGYCLALLLYGMLYLFFEVDFPMMVSSFNGVERRSVKKLKGSLFRSTAARLIVTCSAFYAFVEILHLGALSVLAGYLLAQVGITIAVQRFSPNRVLETNQSPAAILTPYAVEH